MPSPGLLVLIGLLGAPAAAPSSPPAAPAADPACAKQAAVVEHAGAKKPYATVAEAFAAVADGDHVRLCPGHQTLEETLTVSGHKNLRIEAQGAVVIGNYDGSALVFDHADGLTIDDLTVLRGYEGGVPEGPAEAAPPVVAVNDTHGVTLTRLHVDGSRSPALGLTHVTDAKLADSDFTNASIAVVLTESPGATFTKNRVDRSPRVAHPEARSNEVLGGGAWGDKALGRTAPPPGATTPPPPAGATPWPDFTKLVADHPIHPVVVVDKKLWLHLSHEMGDMPGVKVVEDVPSPRPTHAPPKGSGDDLLPKDRRAALVVFTPKGPCKPKVGAPRWVDTRGCEHSYMLALPLEGCGLSTAPFAVEGDIKTAWPAFSYQPIAWKTKPLSAASLKGSPAEAWLTQGFQSSPAGGLAQAATATRSALAFATLATPAERLEAALAGFQFDLGNCRTFESAWRGAFLTVVGATPATPATPPAAWLLPEAALSQTPLDGALLLDGRIAAVTTGGPDHVGLIVRAVDGKLSTVLDADIRSDNEECRGESTAVDFESPCAP